MANSKLTPFEQKEIKLARELADCEAKLAAVQASLISAKPTHRAPLRKLIREFSNTQINSCAKIAQNNYDLEWEIGILRPLILHLNDLGQAWTGQHYCKEAQQYFDDLAKIGDDMVKIYDTSSPIQAMKKRVEDLMADAPMVLGHAKDPSPFYPLAQRRMEASEAVWQEILMELSPKRNQKYFHEGVYGMSGYIDMYQSLGRGAEAVLDGHLDKMSQATEGFGLGSRQLAPLGKLLDQINYDDDYKEDRKAKRAFLQSRKLQEITASATHGNTRARRL